MHCIIEIAEITESAYEKDIMARKSTNVVSLLALAVAGLGTYSFFSTGDQPDKNEADSSQQVTVSHVVDGDTIRVSKPGETETTRVRLLNIDTPELDKECYGEEAKKFVEDLLPEGSTVRLEYDQQRADHYGRELAGVYAGETLVNKEVAAAGLAVPVLVQPNDLYYDEISDAVAAAKHEGKGVFAADSGCNFADYKTRN